MASDDRKKDGCGLLLKIPVHMYTNISYNACIPSSSFLKIS